MGGQGSGRPPSTETLIKRSQPELTPIGNSIFLPNHSGIASHPEFQQALASAGGLWSEGATAGEIYYNAGNVGIGTTDPSQPFHIYNATADAGMLFQTAKADGKATFYLQNDAVVWSFRVNGTASDSLQIVYGATTYVNIDTAGNFGIGIVAPDSKLHVYGSATQKLKVESTAGQPQINFKNSADEWAVYMATAGTDLKFWNGSDFLSLNSDGSVDILGGVLDMNTHQINNVSDPTSAQDAATKAYVDEALGADVTVIKATFDITSNTSVIAAAGAGIKNKIVAISMHNNDADAADDTVVKITDGDAGTVLIGGATGAIYLVGRGGFFGLPMSAAHPWCETTANTALYINPVSGKRVSGAVWYIQEA